MVAIPLSDDYRQSFTVLLGDQTWRLLAEWHPLDASWYLTILAVSTAAEPDPVLSSVRLAAGRRLLQGYRIAFRGDLYVEGAGHPGRSAWSTTHRLVYLEVGE